MDHVLVVLVGWVKNAISVFVKMNYGDPTVQKFVSVKRTIQKCVILGLENAFANQDGMVILVPDLALSTCMEKAVKIVAIAKIMHNAHL